MLFLIMASSFGQFSNSPLYVHSAIKLAVHALQYLDPEASLLVGLRIGIAFNFSKYLAILVSAHPYGPELHALFDDGLTV